MSLRVFRDSIYGLCQVSVHREGDNPSGMEGEMDLDELHDDRVAVLEVLQQSQYKFERSFVPIKSLFLAVI